MADNTIQLKRSSVAGKTPNTSTLATGELAINLTDKKLYSSDGSNIFEPAGNVTDINITGGIKANGSFGTNGYVLSTNGSGIYWTASTGGGPVINTIPSNIRNIVNTSVNTTASVIDTANATGISTVEYIVSARDNINSNFKSSKVVITSNGTVSYIMEYAIVASNDSISVCNFSTNIASGNIRLFATGDSNDTDISLQRVVLGSATEAGDIAASVIVDSVTNTAINVSAAANSVKLAYDTAIAAYSNSVSYTDTKIGTANTAMAANAAAAYTNATIFAANISNVNSGTLSEARLPYRMNQNVRTTDNVQFNDLTVAGNLTISGNTLIVGANNLIVSDAVISLHTPANLAALTSNDGRNIGLAFHYYDTEDKHALLYRDNTTGYLQYHIDGSDPISNNNPIGNNFGTIQTASFWAGNSSVYATVNATTYTGTSNNASNLGGQLPAYYTNATNITTGTLPYAQIPVNVINTTSDFTRTGVTTFSANVVLGTSGVSSNGSFGTAGQILASNGSATYWSTVSGGGFTNGQSISVNNFVITGGFTANSSNGTSGQVLTSNGSAVYWSTISSNATSQTFTGNGTNTVFTLSQSIADQKNIIITLDGLVQVPTTHYSVSGTTLTFTDAPIGNTVIEARTIAGGSGSGGGAVILPAGTTTIPPLNFTSGTNLTTPLAGVMEYDGKVPYFTPQGTQRGIIPGMQYYELNSTLALTATTSAQAWLGVGCTLSSGTVYEFQGTYIAIKTTTTTSHTLGQSFGGTATLNNIGYTLFRYFDAAGFVVVGTAPAAMAYVQTASNITTMGPSVSATNYQIYTFNGIVSVNAGGTFIPQVTTSASGPIYTGQIGSYFRIYPIGAAGSNINVGTWA